MKSPADRQPGSRQEYLTRDPPVRARLSRRNVLPELTTLTPQGHLPEGQHWR